LTSSRFTFHATPLSGLVVVERKPIEDDRGILCRNYCAEEFRDAGLWKPIVQINQTLTWRKGSVRGLHFQHPPHAETKIVYCIKGEIFDVAVDLRKGSPTFLRWHGEILSAANRRSLLVPEGFAHGFQTLVEECELIYLHTASYMPHAEDGLNVLDPRFMIAWPLEISELSERDRAHPRLAVDFEGIAP